MDPISSRRAVRKDINLKGTFKIKDDLKHKIHLYKEPADLTLIDVSPLGCGFMASYYLPKGLILLLRIKAFPIVSDKGAKEATKDIEFTGRVMVCKTMPSRDNKIGLEFAEIKKEDLNLVRSYIEGVA
ncbi:MAG: PilZ domain-containing protein [Candidatus Omnitrophica bacterium]|nr:PilZ domain-containing protein [Candidatus Omnitrophota bacterium]